MKNCPLCFININRQLICFKPSKLWNLVPNEYKFLPSLADFKAKIKTWVSENCPCSLHKTYIHQIGFIKNILGFL